MQPSPTCDLYSKHLKTSQNHVLLLSLQMTNHFLHSTADAAPKPVVLMNGRRTQRSPHIAEQLRALLYALVVHLPTRRLQQHRSIHTAGKDHWNFPKFTLRMKPEGVGHEIMNQEIYGSKYCGSTICKCLSHKINMVHCTVTSTQCALIGRPFWPLPIPSVQSLFARPNLAP